MASPKYIHTVVFITLLCLLFFIGQSQTIGKSNFTITCYIKGSDGGKILLANKPKGGMFPTYKIKYFDSCFSISDSFKFSFSLKESAIYSIEIKGKKGWCSFIATPQKDIKIVGNIDSLYKSKIYGSIEDSLYNILAAKVDFLYMDMYKAQKDSMSIYMNKIEEVRYNFIRQNPASFVSTLDIELNSYNKLDSEQLGYLKKSYLVLTPKARELKTSKNAFYNLFIAPEKLTPNNKIPNFNFINYNTHSFDLYGYLQANKKKYYLIDFWATWCKPCIAQFPALKEIYNKYQNKILDIIGYSLDVDKNKFEEFMNKQTMDWEIVTDLKGNQSTVYKLFKLGAIPSNFLIDGSGIIIDVDIKPDNLLKFLEKQNL